MALISPHITDKFTAYLGDDITTNLSMAVWLIDDFSKTEPVGNIRVKIADGTIIAFRNLSGYYCFTGLLPGSYKLTVESDMYFSPEEHDVNIPVPDVKQPLEILLKPGPAYPFGSNATLVRGVVWGEVLGVSAPSVNAQVKVASKGIETMTDDKGEFVLYFKGIAEESVTIEIENTEGTSSVPVTIKEGETKSVGRITLT